MTEDEPTRVFTAIDSSLLLVDHVHHLLVAMMKASVVPSPLKCAATVTDGVHTMR
jgi:hypothetical protein